MRHIGMSAMMVLAVVVFGCGPAKEMPKDVVGPTITPGPAPDPLGKAPSESTPEAKAVLDRAVKVITQGDPSRLAQVKTSVARYQGGFQFPTTPAMTETTLLLEAAWPDRAVFTFSFKEGIPTISFRLVEREGWMIAGGQEQGGDPVEVGHLVYADLVANYAMPLGLTLADTRTIAYEPKKLKGATTVKVAAPGAPIMLVTFDEQSGLPTRVEYNPLELNKQRVAKAAVLGDHKPQGGLLIPSTIELSQNGKPVQKWTLEKWDFATKVDPAAFSRPK